MLSYPPLPPPTHSYVRPVLTHVFSAACYTGLATGIPRWWVVVAVDDTYGGDDRLTTWLGYIFLDTSCGPPPSPLGHGRMRPSAIIGDRSTLRIRSPLPARPRLTTLPNRADANTGVPNWVSTHLARADSDTAGPNRAHDRPPSRTTKTATLYTNPATSWQIDVRDYINTLIVVDLSKSQVDYN